MNQAKTLRFMEMFLAVADTGSMSRAASKLGVSQAAISQNIRLLESALGSELFDRGVRPVQLTSAGLVLQVRARHLLKVANETWGSVKDVGKSRLPDLRLAVVNSLAGPLLPELYEMSKARLWQENFSMRSGLGLGLNEALLNREVDVVVTAEPMDDVTGLEHWPVLREAFLLVGPRSLIEAPDDLEVLSKDLPFLRYIAHSVMGRTIDQHLRRLRVDVPRRAEFDSSWSIGQMVRSEKGWSVMTPLCLLEAYLQPQDISIHPFPYVAFTRSVWLTARQGELGNLPEQLAMMVRDALAQRRDSEIAAFGPLAKSAFQIVNGQTPMKVA